MPTGVQPSTSTKSITDRQQKVKKIRESILGYINTSNIQKTNKQFSVRQLEILFEHYEASMSLRPGDQKQEIDELIDIDDYSQDKKSQSSSLKQESANSDRTNAVTRKDLEMSQPIDITKAIRRPDRFNGNKPSPLIWIDDYIECGDINAWTDELRLQYLPAFLDETAYNWFRYQIKPMTNKTWNQVLTLFKRQFCTKQERALLHDRLDRRQQRPDEPVSSFITNIQALIAVAAPEMSLENQINMIIKKLHSSFTSRVIVAEPTSYSELVSLCLKIEAANRTSRSKNADSVHKTNPQQQRQNRPSTSGYGRGGRARRDNGARPTQTRPPQPSRPGRDLSEVTCYNCKAKGHYSTSCPHPPQPKQPNKPAVKKINSAKPKDEPEPKQVVKFKHTVRGIIDDGSIYHQVFLNKRPTRALIDSGASTSVIDWNFCKQKGFMFSSESRHSLTAAGNSRLRTVGSLEGKLRIRVDDISKSTEVDLPVVANLGTNLIIGQDLLGTMKITIDCENREIAFKDANENLPPKEPPKPKKPKPAKGSAVKPYKGPVTVKKTQLVPTKSELWIEADVSTEEDVIVSGYDPTNSEIFVANTIARPQHGSINILVLNPLSADLMVEEGQCVAIWETLPTEHEIRLLVDVETKDGKATIEVGDQLDKQQISDITKMVREYHDVFSFDGHIGKTDVDQHHIELTSEAKPFIEPLRRKSEKEQVAAEEQISEMLEMGVIEPSKSSWASAYVIVKKRDGGLRFCIDFRRLNKMTKSWCYPLPRCDEILDKTAGSYFYTSLDLNSGYWQVPVADESKEYTSFRCRSGQYQFTRMPFGLVNAGATFQRLMNNVIRPLDSLEILVYLDDVVIFSKEWSSHVEQLRRLLQAFRKANLTVKPNKCIFGTNKLKFLGHVVSHDGLTPDPNKTRAISEMPPPHDLKTVRSFLGAASYYRKFVHNFASICSPITELTKLNTPFVWGRQQKAAFNQIKEELLKAAVTHFDNTKPVELKTDASYTGIAGMILQNDQIVTCVSRRLSNSELNYSVTEVEALALVWSVTKLRPYILGVKTTVWVDHCALCALATKKPLTGRLARWAILLSEFELDIRYQLGTAHNDIDCLSRLPVDDENDWRQEALLPVNNINMIIPFSNEAWIESYAGDDECEDIIADCTYDQAKKYNAKLVDDVIYSHDDKLFIPKSGREEILHAAHAAPLAGHGGHKATLSKLSDDYWWPDMAKDVNMFVDSCESCQRYKKTLTKFGELTPFNVTRPFEMWALDFIGPISKADDGCDQILVAIDHFSKMIEATPCAERTSKIVSRFLIDNIYSRHGPPTSILVDNAGEMISKAVKETCKLIGTQHVRCTPYHSRGNPCVERVNRTIVQKMSLYIAENNKQEKDWPTALQLIVYAINTTRHQSTGYTPFELIYGFNPTVALETLNRTNVVDILAQNIQFKLSITQRDALLNTREAQLRSKERFDMGRTAPKFKVGDKVLIEMKLARSGKLTPIYKGPFEIIEELPNNIFKCRDLELFHRKGNKDSRFSILRSHVERLRPYVERGAEEEDESNNPVPSTSGLTNRIHTDIKYKRGIRCYSCNNYGHFSRDCTQRNRASKGLRHRTLLALTAILAICYIPKPSRSEFQHAEEDVIWRKTHHVVVKGAKEWQLAAQIESPCNLLDIPIYDPDHNRVIKSNKLYSLCLDLYTKEVTERIHKLCPIKTLSDYSMNDPSSVIKPTYQRLVRNPKTAIIVYKRQVGVLIAMCWAVSDIVQSRSGVTDERIVDSINTHAREIGCMSHAMLQLEKTLNASVQLELHNSKAIELLAVHVAENTKRLKALADYTPQESWLITYVHSKITHTGSLLEATQLAWNEKKISRGLLEIFNLTHFEDFDEDGTVARGCTISEINAINIRFTVRTPDRTTVVAQADPFEIWENVTGTPCLTRYNGPSFMIYNASADCRSGLQVPTFDKFSTYQCAIPHHEDESFEYRSRIKCIPPGAPIEPRVQYKTTISKNDRPDNVFIYCYGTNITITAHNNSYLCPPHVFSLPPSISWRSGDVEFIAEYEEITAKTNNDKDLSEFKTIFKRRKYRPEKEPLNIAIKQIQNLREKLVNVSIHNASSAMEIHQATLRSQLQVQTHLTTMESVVLSFKLLVVVMLLIIVVRPCIRMIKKIVTHCCPISDDRSNLSGTPPDIPMMSLNSPAKATNGTAETIPKA